MKKYSFSDFVSGGPMGGPAWYEYTFTPYAGDPTVTLSVNGAQTTTIHDGDTLAYSWNIANADIVEGEFSGGKDYQTVIGSVDLCELRYDLRTILPLRAFVLNPFPPMVGDMPAKSNSQTVTDLIQTAECQVGRTFHFEIRVKQSRTGKSASASVTVIVPGYRKLSDLWDVIVAPTPNLYEANHVTGNVVSVNQNTTTNVPVWIINDTLVNPNVDISVDSTSPGITATLTRGGGPSSSPYLYRTGTLAITTTSSTVFPAQIKLKSTFAGDTKYTTITVNQN
jgi:hypothetical protein